jgi:hypothetical protein
MIDHYQVVQIPPAAQTAAYEDTVYGLANEIQRALEEGLLAWSRDNNNAGGMIPE